MASISDIAPLNTTAQTGGENVKAADSWRGDLLAEASADRCAEVTVGELLGLGGGRRVEPSPGTRAPARAHPGAVLRRQVVERPGPVLLVKGFRKGALGLPHLGALLVPVPARLRQLGEDLSLFGEVNPFGR